MNEEGLHCRARFCTEHVANAWDVCDLCWDYRYHWRDDLVDLYLRAGAALVPGSKPLDQRVSSSDPEGSMPLRMAPLSAMADALVRVEKWADTILRRGCPGRLPERGTARDLFIFSRAVLLLGRYDHELRGGPLAGDYYDDLYRAYWRLYRIDRHGLEVVRCPDPCPCCGRASVMERHAGEWLQCLTCASTWTQASWAIHRDRSTT